MRLAKVQVKETVLSIAAELFCLAGGVRHHVAPLLFVQDSNAHSRQHIRLLRRSSQVCV